MFFCQRWYSTSHCCLLKFEGLQTANHMLFRILFDTSVSLLFITFSYSYPLRRIEGYIFTNIWGKGRYHRKRWRCLLLSCLKTLCIFESLVEKFIQMMAQSTYVSFTCIWVILKVELLQSFDVLSVVNSDAPTVKVFVHFHIKLSCMGLC